MSQLTKTMLDLMVINAVASVLFLTGLVDISGLPGLYVTFPLAAVFYGMFLISLMMEGEVAKFDAEQGAHHDHAAPASHSESVDSVHDHEHHEPMHA